jgi:hypothetical protein
MIFNRLAPQSRLRIAEGFYVIHNQDGFDS